MGCCKYRQLTENDEKNLMIKSFQWLNIIQALAVIILCIITMTYLSSTNLSSFLPIDIETMVIAVIILSLILVIVGTASASTNTPFAWFFFHIFLIALLAIELSVSSFTSDLSGFMKSAKELWDSEENEETLIALQFDLECCGFNNLTQAIDQGTCPFGALAPCETKLRDILISLKNTTCVAMFACFVIGLFIDFAGCVICFHPDIITLAAHECEMTEIAAQQMDMEKFENPFAKSDFL